MDNFKKYLNSKGFDITNIEPDEDGSYRLIIHIELWMNDTIFGIDFVAEDNEDKGYVSLSDFLSGLDSVRTLGNDELAKSAWKIVEELIDSVEEDFTDKINCPFQDIIG